MLALLGYLRDPSTTSGPDEVRRQCPTYSEWKNPSDANPITYPELTPQLLATLRGTGALFARKFRADTVSVDHWDRVVREAARNTSSRSTSSCGSGSVGSSDSGNSTTSGSGSGSGLVPGSSISISISDSNSGSNDNSITCRETTTLSKQQEQDKSKSSGSSGSESRSEEESNATHGVAVMDNEDDEPSSKRQKAI